MARFAKLLAFGLAVTASAAPAAGSAPSGAWRTTNDCFLAGFILADNGKARAAYLNGDRDDNAAWTWDGATLTITAPSFPLDKFAGRMAGDHVEADYVWHDLDKDHLNTQACIFESFTLYGIF